MNKKRNVSTMGQVINNIVGNRKWDEKLERHRLFSFWEEVVGDEISSHAWPKLLRGSVLWVDVTDSVWMQQLHFQKMEILKSINAKLHDTMINDIRFKLVKSITQKHDRAVANITSRTPTEPKPEETVLFEKITSAIEDESIRKSMKKLWLAQKNRTK